MDRLLVVEDENITSDLLRRYFDLMGYEVINSTTGMDAIRKAIEYQPRVIILDIMLPDMDGYNVCRRLRSDGRTNQIPIIFLTQKDSRRDRLDGLELGADDYLTKPFDMEELRLKVHNIIERMGGTTLVDARTSLPNMALIKERLPQLLSDPNTCFIDVQILYLDDFARQYGPVAANQVIRSAAKIIGDVLHEVDPSRAFIGQPRDDHFLLATVCYGLEWVAREVMARFDRHVIKFYDYPDQRRGWMLMGDQIVPFMTFKVMRVKTSVLRALANSSGASPRGQ